MKKVGIIGAVLVGSIAGLSSLAWAAGALDGKTFTGQVGPQGKTESRPDDFVFQDGKFESTLCKTFGYGQGDYQAKAEGDAVEFVAKTTSTTGGIMEWQGTVKGDQIEGTTVSTENGKISQSWFKGALKTQGS